MKTMIFDYSKNIINQQNIATCYFNWPRNARLQEGIKAMFDGEKINETENRAVLHVALRNFSNTEYLVDGRRCYARNKPGEGTDEKFCE